MTKGNRIYKDRLFKFVFNDEEKLLSLYNALNHSDYKDPDALEINTLEDFIYIRMKNDISFILDSDMCLYEHQSTYNPNMPLRGLFYFADLLQQFVEKKGYNIYGSTLLAFPTPQFVVFYNGDDTIYTDLDTAIDSAIDYCIEHDIMREILLKHKAEVARLIFREFDEAEYMRLVEKDTERQIAAFKEEIALQKEQLSQKDEQLIQKDEQLKKYKRMLEEHGLLTPDK